ncbi:hypothetical protein ANN_00765 [Periplaneta americana]|uniref:Uncharacterized protein n=1 Tax=Periplaneta americana TaxID=6978 RepID=A0ABQ8TRS2_PERAM|nr:hypothetical protein ANN_00765 [Periplaneta americana]
MCTRGTQLKSTVLVRTSYLWRVDIFLSSGIRSKLKRGEEFAPTEQVSSGRRHEFTGSQVPVSSRPRSNQTEAMFTNTDRLFSPHSSTTRKSGESSGIEIRASGRHLSYHGIDKEVQTAVKSRFRIQAADFYDARMQKLIP